MPRGGPAQEFDDSELDDPALADLDRNDPFARLRRGPLTFDYWMRLADTSWRSLQKFADAN